MKRTGKNSRWQHLRRAETRVWIRSSEREPAAVVAARGQLDKQGNNLSSSTFG